MWQLRERVFSLATQRCATSFHAQQRLHESTESARESPWGCGCRLGELHPEGSDPSRGGLLGPTFHVSQQSTFSKIGGSRVECSHRLHFRHGARLPRRSKTRGPREHQSWCACSRTAQLACADPKTDERQFLRGSQRSSFLLNRPSRPF